MKKAGLITLLSTIYFFIINPSFAFSQGSALEGAVFAIGAKYKGVPNAAVALYDKNILDEDESDSADPVAHAITDQRGYYKLNIPIETGDLFVQVICGDTVYEYINIDGSFSGTLKLDSRIDRETVDSCPDPTLSAVPFIPEEMEEAQTNAPPQNYDYNLPIRDSTFKIKHEEKSMIDILLGKVSQFFDWIGSLGLRYFHVSADGSKKFRALNFGKWITPNKQTDEIPDCEDLKNKLTGLGGEFNFGIFQKLNTINTIKSYSESWVKDKAEQIVCQKNGANVTLAQIQPPWETSKDGYTLSSVYWPGGLYGGVAPAISKSQGEARNWETDSFKVEKNGPGNEQVDKNIYHPGGSDSIKSVEEGVSQVSALTSILGSDEGSIAPDAGPRIYRTKSFVRLAIDSENDSPFAFRGGKELTHISTVSGAYREVEECVDNLDDPGPIPEDLEEAKKWLIAYQKWMAGVEACDEDVIPFTEAKAKVEMSYVDEWEKSTNSFLSKMFLITDPHRNEGSAGFVSAGDDKSDIFTAISGLLAKNRLSKPVGFDTTNSIERLWQALTINFPYSPGTHRTRTEGDGTIESDSPYANEDIDTAIKDAALRNNVPESLLRAIYFIEGGEWILRRECHTSTAGAIGPFQIKPGTLRLVATASERDKINLCNPGDAAEIASRILKSFKYGYSGVRDNPAQGSISVSNHKEIASAASHYYRGDQTGCDPDYYTQAIWGSGVSYCDTVGTWMGIGNCGTDHKNIRPDCLNP